VEAMGIGNQEPENGDESERNKKIEPYKKNIK
jgi:hypothetical protein